MCTLDTYQRIEIVMDHQKKLHKKKKILPLATQYNLLLLPSTIATALLSSLIPDMCRRLTNAIYILILKSSEESDTVIMYIRYHLLMDACTSLKLTYRVKTANSFGGEKMSMCRTTILQCIVD